MRPKTISIFYRPGSDGHWEESGRIGRTSDIYLPNGKDRLRFGFSITPLDFPPEVTYFLGQLAIDLRDLCQGRDWLDRFDNIEERKIMTMLLDLHEDIEDEQDEDAEREARNKRRRERAKAKRDKR